MKLLLLTICLVLVACHAPSDAPKRLLSIDSVIVDPETGCEYFSLPYKGFPRYSSDGRTVMGCKDAEPLSFQDQSNYRTPRKVVFRSIDPKLVYYDSTGTHDRYKR